MGVLDQLLEYKKYKDAQSNADLQAIPQAAMLYQQGKQQQLENTIKTLTLQGTLAKSGIGIGPNNQLVPDNRFLTAQNKGVYTVDANGNLTQAGTVPGKSVVKQLPLTPDQMGKRAEAQRSAIVNNPNIDQSTRDAISAKEYISPRVTNASDIVNGLDDFENLIKQIQIGSNKELIVPNGSPLEELTGLINDIKLTGFNLGGKNLTEGEKEIVYSRLNPIGKSKERFLRDIKSLPDFFQSKINAGTIGLDSAREKSGYSSSTNLPQDNQLKVGGTFNGAKILKVTKK